MFGVFKIRGRLTSKNYITFLRFVFFCISLHAIDCESIYVFIYIKIIIIYLKFFNIKKEKTKIKN